MEGNVATENRSYLVITLLDWSEYRLTQRNRIKECRSPSEFLGP